MSGVYLGFSFNIKIYLLSSFIPELEYFYFILCFINTEEQTYELSDLLVLRIRTSLDRELFIPYFKLCCRIIKYYFGNFKQIHIEISNYHFSKSLLWKITKNG